MKHRMILPERNGILYKFIQLTVPAKSLPVDPACNIILAVSIVITTLGIAELIAVIDHRNSLA